MVDFKLFLYPELVRKVALLRRRCKGQKHKSTFCNLNDFQEESNKYFSKKCSCRTHLKYTNHNSPNYNFDPQIKRNYMLAGVTILIIVAICVGAYCTGAFSRQNGDGDAALSPSNPTKPLPPSNSILRVFKKAAVCADSVICAQVGKDILEKNGTAVDAAIATLFCNGMVTMQSMGLGGGFLMTIYKRNEKKAHFLNAREKAPLEAKNELYKKDELTSRNGPLAIAVPGELKGYWELYKKFGTLKWKDLVQPTIDICNKGYIMTKHQYTTMTNKPILKDDENFKAWFVDKNNEFKKVGSKIIPQKLCETLALIAENGGNDFYNGTLSKMFLEDIKEAGGIITAKDMENYEVEWLDPITTTFSNNDTLYTAPPPGSGAILSFILGILDGYNFNKESIEDVNSTVLTYHRMIEAFKYAYAKRTELGDLNFVNITGLLSNLTSAEYAANIREKIWDNTTFQDPKHYGAVYYDKGDHGTAHISIIDQNGDAVSVTSSINLYFGNGMTSKQTGIIYNSVMDDFSFPYFKNYFGLPGSPNNEMLPGKRPLSSMSPSIIVDRNGDAKMVVGAAGGTVITSTVAWTVIRTLWFGENVKEAVDAPRIHHQLYPMHIMYEYGILQQVVDGLKGLGHKMHRNFASVVCALIKRNEQIFANADHRKGGDVFGLG